MTTFTGTSLKDKIKGTQTADTMFGLLGDDILLGLGGKDTLYGGDGRDILDGGLGADKMYGGKGNDIYFTDNSHDVVVEKFNQGTDVVKSTVSHTLETNVEYLTLLGSAALKGIGNTLANVVTGNAGNNILDGHEGNDTLRGGGGNDTLIGGGGKDHFDGGTGTDTVDYHTDTSGLAVQVDLSGVHAQLGAAAGETFVSIENVTGTNVAGPGDSLYGDNHDNVLSGLAGNDTLAGGGGLDTLIGGAGNDTFIGGDFGSGSDIYNGGVGFDLVDYLGSSNQIAVDLFFTDTPTGGVGGLNSDHFISIEAVRGGDNPNGDILSGSEAGNTLAGMGGNDQLFGRGGPDTLYGGDGDDTIDPGDDLAFDTVDGGAGTDTLTYAGHSHGVFVQISGTLGLGGHGVINDSYANIENVVGTSLSDTIILDNTAGIILSADGGDGSDTLESRAGVNSAAAIEFLTGGQGQDIFVLHPLSFAHVTDFVDVLQLGDHDKIRLGSSEVGGITDASGNLTNRTNDHNATLGHAGSGRSSTHSRHRTSGTKGQPRANFCRLERRTIRRRVLSVNIWSNITSAKPPQRTMRETHSKTEPAFGHSSSGSLPTA